MKKNFITVIIGILITTFAFGLTSCNLLGDNTNITTKTGQTTIFNETTAPSNTTVTTDTTDNPLEVNKMEKEVPKSIKILAIGNSFSTDCMEYLYDIASSAGVENIVLGNLYYAGCSLQEHLNFAKSESAEYKYYKNTAGTWVNVGKYSMKTALSDESWDYISFQQTSKTCGLQSSYGTVLTELVDYVEDNNPNDNTKLIWNMTWAYQQDSTHTSFPNYDNSQITMYNMIIDCVNNCIIPEERFSIIIPCMTSIQNARTSFIGDTLTRDGFHLNYYIGRYIVGLTWYAAITDSSIDEIKYYPDPQLITQDMKNVAIESVKNAIYNPYEITASNITTGELPDDSEIDANAILNPADYYEIDDSLASINNVDLDNYTLLEWDYNENSYWYCTKQTGITIPSATASTYHQNISSKLKYEISSEIPVGSIIICDSGWQYRFELYQSTTGIYTGNRPDMQNDRFFILTNDFLNDAKYIAWNVASDPKSDISEIYQQASCHLRIYVPNEQTTPN